MDFWRVIDHPAGDAAWNMAVDEALLRSYTSGKGLATIRFYSWEVPSISLGRFQKIDGSLDLPFCASRGIAIVRRPTGGRAVLHGTDLTFSVVQQNTGHSVQDSYRKLSAGMHTALLTAGVPADTFNDLSDSARMRSVPNCFDLKAAFELALNGKKILGCAQLRRENAILQQNSLVLAPPASDNLNAFVGHCPDAGGACVSDYATRQVIILSLCREIEHLFGVSLRPSNLTVEEESIARVLAESKYRADQWNLNGRGIVDT
jgi:lipoate-protein ligase A